MFYLFLFYFAFRIIYTLIGIIVYSKDFSQYKSDEIESSDWNPNKVLMKKKKTFYFRIYKFFSIIKGFNYVFGKDKNQIYMENDIQFICGTKAVFFLLYTIEVCFMALNVYPHVVVDDQQFIKSLWIILIKISTFANECIICLNGILLTFKLMNYLKKYDTQFDFVSFVYFSLSLIYKVFAFYFLFSIFYLNVDFFSTNSDYSSFDYFKENEVFHSRDCYINITNLFIPLYYQYIYYNETTNLFFNGCFRPFYYMQSEFYCIIVTLIIFYCLLKFKSRALEIFLMISLAILIGLIYLNYDGTLIINNIDFFLGDNISIKKPHILFISYFLGNIAGVTYFYYCDIISPSPMIDNNPYLPFKYLYNVIKSYDQFRMSIKYFITFIFILIVLGINSIFYCLINNSDDFYIKYNQWIKFIYIYEKCIFNLCLLVLMLCSVAFKKSILRRTLSSFLFVSLNKFSWIFLLLIDFFSYLFYGLLKIENSLNMNDIVLFSIGLFIFLYFLSALITILIEIPFRVILKKKLRKFLIKKKN